MTKFTPTMIEVLTPQVVLVENTIHCSTECPFMRMVQDDHTLEFWKVCVLGSPIIPLERVEERLYERTDACKQAESDIPGMDEEIKRAAQEIVREAWNRAVSNAEVEEEAWAST